MGILQFYHFIIKTYIYKLGTWEYCKFIVWFLSSPPQIIFSSQNILCRLHEIWEMCKLGIGLTLDIKKVSRWDENFVIQQSV